MDKKYVFIRVVWNTHSLSAEASLCRRPRLGRRENEVRGGGGGGSGGRQFLLPSCAACWLFFYFLITIFDQLSILSRVVNSMSCYVSQLLCQVFIGTSSWQKKFLCKVFFDNNDRRNIKLTICQIRGGHRNYVT